MNAELQYIIVGLFVAAALAYAVVTFTRKTRTFSPKSTCENDCGCGGTSKKTTT